MPVNIKDEATDRLVRALAQATGESLTEAVATAVRERLDRVQGARGAPDLARAIESIAARCAALPELDSRSADQILGYNEVGLPS